MKIQVIGGRGMLGQAVMAAAKAAGHAPLSLGGHYGDITRCDVFAETVINCAGLVKQRTDVPDSQFMLVNAYGPHRLAEACDAAGARLIHVSTDCVFAGPGPHWERDVPDGRGIYARSKIAGEVTRPPHLTVRCSFVGPGPRGLLADLLDKRDQKVQASRHALWTGHTVGTVARVLVALAERPDVTGLLHIPAEPMSRPILLFSLSERFRLNLEIEATEEPAEDRRLCSERWDALGLPTLPDFQEQLKEMEL